MFERFTDRARRVVVLSQEEARLLNHNYIGTEHLLLGLLDEADGVAARVLDALGVTTEAVRPRIEAIVGEGSNSPSEHIPFTPRAKKVLEYALREALQLGHNYIGTEHILLGLIREGQGIAAQVLSELGIKLAAVRYHVVELLGPEGAGREPIEEFEPRSAGGQEVLVESLMGEVRRLRGDVDRLRAALRQAEAEPEPAEPGAQPVPRLPDPETAPDQTLLRCSFCGQRHDEVAKLIAGPGVYICDRCITLCQEILAEANPPSPADPSDPPGDPNGSP